MRMRTVLLLRFLFPGSRLDVTRNRLLSVEKLGGIEAAPGVACPTTFIRNWDQRVMNRRQPRC